jgi:hypothetical protein
MIDHIKSQGARGSIWKKRGEGWGSCPRVPVIPVTYQGGEKNDVPKHTATANQPQLTINEVTADRDENNANKCTAHHQPIHV